MKSILLLLLFLLSCATTNKPIDFAENNAQSIPIAGHNQFTIYTGLNLLGRIQTDDGGSASSFLRKIYTGEVQRNAVIGVKELSFKDENLVQVQTKLSTLYSSSAEFKKFREVKVKLVNPKEFILENPKIVYSFNKGRIGAEERTKPYIYSILHVDEIQLEVVDREGVNITSGADLEKKHGIKTAANVKSDTNSSAIIAARDAFIGYKIKNPDNSIREVQTEEEEKEKRAVVVFDIESENEADQALKPWLIQTTESALSSAGMKVYIRDRNWAEIEKEPAKKKDSISTGENLNANTIAKGFFIRNGNSAEIQLRFINREFNTIFGEESEQRFEDFDPENEEQRKEVKEKWRKLVVSNFKLKNEIQSTLKGLEKEDSKSTKAELEYAKGIEKYLLHDEESYKESIPYFKKAISIDSEFSRAYASLSEAYTGIIQSRFGTREDLSSEETLEREKLEKEAFENALQAEKIAKTYISKRALARHFFQKSLNPKNFNFRADRKDALQFAEEALSLNSKDAPSAWLVFLIKAKDNREILNDKTHPDLLTANSLNPDLFEVNLNLALIAESSDKDGISRSIEFYKKALEKSPKNRALFFQLARVHRKLDKFEDSYYYIKKAEETKIFDSELYLNFARHFRDKKNYDTGEKYYLKVWNKFPKDRLKILLELTDYYSYYSGWFDKGIYLYTEAAMSKDSLSYLYNREIGKLYLRKNNAAKALSYLQQSESLLKEKEDRSIPDLISVYNLMGIAYRDLKNYDSALDIYNSSLKLSKEFYGEEHPSNAKIYNNTSMVYADKGEFDKAITSYKQSLALNKKEYGENHPFTAVNYNNIGDVYFHWEKYDEALPYFTKSLGIFQSELGKDHPQTLITGMNLGNLHFQRALKYSDDTSGKQLLVKEELGKAEKYFLETLELRKNKIAVDTLALAENLHSLGKLYHYSENYSKALVYEKEALPIYEKLKDPFVLLEINGTLGGLYADSGQLQNADTSYWNALRAYWLIGFENPDQLESIYNGIVGLYDTGKGIPSKTAKNLSARFAAFGSENPAAKDWTSKKVQDLSSRSIKK